MLPQCLLSDVEGSQIQSDHICRPSDTFKLGTLKRRAACYDVSFVPLCVIIIIIVVIVMISSFFIHKSVQKQNLYA